jgi:hypothetical protein
MSEQQGRTDMAQDPSRKEQAEGSRDNVNVEDGSAQEGAGITNRPLEREQQEQENVPPRGESKDGAHA